MLKKRDEENTVTISQQKRKITRLQDTLNTQRGKLAKQEKTQRDEMAALREEYQKNNEQFRELQKKVKHFQLTDAKRFRDIWAMNEEKVRSLATDVLNADEIIHRQQLGLEWEAPPPVESPVATAFVRTETQMSQATLYASQILSEAGSDRDEGKAPSVASTTTTIYPPFLVKQVLELLCEETGFLIESKLTRLLAPLETEEKMLMKLDSVFKALGIETEEDIHKLVQYFLLEEGEEERPETTDTEELGATVAEGGAKLALIHPNDVPQALRKFVEHTQGSTKSSLTPKTLALGARTKKAHEELLDGSFWKQMAGILPESHERLWSALTEGLEKYHSTLTARMQLIQETDSLRQQNIELRLLLQQYMYARINQELEIPPMLVMPVTAQSSAM